MLLHMRKACLAVVQSLSHVQLFEMLWTVAHSLLCPRDFPGKNTGLVSISFSRGSSLRIEHISSALAGKFLTTEPPGKLRLA